MGRIHQSAKQKHIWPKNQNRYSRFNLIDGSHSWQQQVPESCVLYPTRKLNSGRVAYFNFHLAKEMGLIENSHTHRLNKQLEKTLIDTFSLRIVNEYDQAQNVKYHPTVLKKNKYMATRYLQLQHKNKKGKTSGDGRSIWNGEIRHNGQTWDISSRGTGVTRLSPGAVLANRPLQSGDDSVGYSCGLADIDELVGAAIQAEIFHCHKLNTERVLCIIDLGDGNAIGVRAGKNLFRPAHLFLHLKQNNHAALTQAADYIIDRQFSNKEWAFNSTAKNRYPLLLEELTSRFAKFAALLDREYVFAWLDWDGDNVLIDAGIIDYGSIRQFGLRHDEYRYDDVDRYSTNLNEQVKKSRNLIRVFAQMTHFLTTKQKLPLESFSQHPSIKKFDALFEEHLLTQFLIQVGLPAQKRAELLDQHRPMVSNLYRSYSELEAVKTKRGIKRVTDGVNRPAIFNMRTALYELPSLLLVHYVNHKKLEMPSYRQFFKLILAKSAKGKDRKLNSAIRQKIENFLGSYKKLLLVSTPPTMLRSQLLKIFNSAYAANPPDRMTGDGLLYIVEEILKHKGRRRRNGSVQEAIDHLIYEQTRTAPNRHPELFTSPSRKKARDLVHTMLSLVDGHKESI